MAALRVRILGNPVPHAVQRFLAVHRRAGTHLAAAGAYSRAVAASFETLRLRDAPQDEVCRLLAVRSAATPRASNHEAPRMPDDSDPA